MGWRAGLSVVWVARYMHVSNRPMCRQMKLNQVCVDNASFDLSLLTGWIYTAPNVRSVLQSISFILESLQEEGGESWKRWILGWCQKLERNSPTCRWADVQDGRSCWPETAGTECGDRARNYRESFRGFTNWVGFRQFKLCFHSFSFVFCSKSYVLKFAVSSGGFELDMHVFCEFFNTKMVNISVLSRCVLTIFRPIHQMVVNSYSVADSKAAPPPIGSYFFQKAAFTCKRHICNCAHLL